MLKAADIAGTVNCIYGRYAKDILSDPFYRALERNYGQLKIILMQFNIFFFAGLAAGLAGVTSWSGAGQPRRWLPHLGSHSSVLSNSGARISPASGGRRGQAFGSCD